MFVDDETEKSYIHASILAQYPVLLRVIREDVSMENDWVKLVDNVKAHLADIGMDVKIRPYIEETILKQYKGINITDSPFLGFENEEDALAFKLKWLMK